MKLSVHLVTWNGAKYVPHLLYSLRHQTFTDWTLRIFDNASGDGMMEKMREQIQDFPVPVECIQNATNSGFAGGHNTLFRTMGDAEYFLCLNQDMYLEPDCFEKLVRFLDTHKNVAAASPRLMKWNFSVLENDKAGMDGVYSDQIDSLGLKVFRNRRVIEQHGQEVWSQIQNKFQNDWIEVFGVSGALPIFRSSAMKNIAFEDGSFFDESYHSYKEDVDIAFRLRSVGYSACIVLSAVAFHDRSAAGPKELNDHSALKNKQKQSEWVKYHSYKNHLMTLYKNEYWQNVLLDFFPILWYEGKKFVYFLFFDRKVLSGWKAIWNMRKSLQRKNKFLHEKRQISVPVESIPAGWKRIRKWWT